MLLLVRCISHKILSFITKCSSHKQRQRNKTPYLVNMKHSRALLTGWEKEESVVREDRQSPPNAVSLLVYRQTLHELTAI